MNGKAPTLRLEAKRTLFYILVLAGFLAGLWLKFLAGGALRGNLYDVLLVFVLASTTFSVRTQRLLGPAADEADPGRARRRQSALNRTSVAAWVAVAGIAELVQGLLLSATGEDVLGRFDPVDLACYLAGAALSYAVNRLLYLDRTEPQG
ncbi:MAG: hypothetical protein IPH09_17585 [bacterium]|nr:hypothetical protein [bacterium]